MDEYDRYRGPPGSPGPYDLWERPRQASLGADVFVSEENASTLTHSIAPVVVSVMKMIRTLPLVGVVGSSFVAYTHVMQNDDTAPKAAKNFAIGAVMVASKGLANLEIDTVIESAREVRKRLADKQFIAATAAAIAGITEIGTEMLAGPIVSHAAREGVRKAVAKYFGEENVPQRSDTLETIANSSSLIKRHVSLTRSKI